MSFDVVIEAMLFCLVADEEMFMGRERFCEDFILDYLNSITKETIKKGLITVARKINKTIKLMTMKISVIYFSKSNNLDHVSLLEKENLKPKEEVKPPRPPTPPPIIEDESSSEEEDNAVDLFAGHDLINEEDRKSKISSPSESSDSEPEEVAPPPVIVE